MLTSSLSRDMVQEEPASQKPGERDLCNKIVVLVCDVSIIAATLISAARNPEVQGNELSHSAELLAKEIRRRTAKISGLLDHLHDSVQAKKDAAPAAAKVIEREASPC